MGSRGMSHDISWWNMVPWSRSVVFWLPRGYGKFILHRHCNSGNARNVQCIQFPILTLLLILSTLDFKWSLTVPQNLLSAERGLVCHPCAWLKHRSPNCVLKGHYLDGTFYNETKISLNWCDGCNDVTCLSMLCWSSSAYSRAGGGTPGGGAMYIRGEWMMWGRVLS